MLTLLQSVVYRVAITISKLVWSDPLGSFSGPLSHRLSEVPRIFHLVRGDLPFHIAKLHAKYGRVVRIGPNQLSFAEPQAWKDIYGHRTGGQAEFSKFPGFYRPDQSLPESIITIHDPTDHAQLRRQLSHGFSEKSLRGQEPIIVGYVDLMVERLYDRTLRGPVLLDMSEWLNWATFDIIGDLGFGSSFGCLEKGDFHPWVRLVTSAVKTATYMQVLVGLGATKMVSWMAFMGGTKAREESRALVMEKLQQRMELGADRPDLFEGLLRMQKEHVWPQVVLCYHLHSMQRPCYSCVTGHAVSATSHQRKRHDDCRIRNHGYVAVRHSLPAGQEPSSLVEARGRGPLDIPDGRGDYARLRQQAHVYAGLLARVSEALSTGGRWAAQGRAQGRRIASRQHRPRGHHRRCLALGDEP